MATQHISSGIPKKINMIAHTMTTSCSVISRNRQDTNASQAPAITKSLTTVWHCKLSAPSSFRITTNGFMARVPAAASGYQSLPSYEDFTNLFLALRFVC
uniref:(northern house mosquito) hypothetical protein n=1 Tax=Culex pipiens TaxID=7175 RepID=A0A8D7ZUK6_CULPI